MAPLEVRKDTLGGDSYASRNLNDYSATLEKVDLQRADIDWQITLRLRNPPVEGHIPDPNFVSGLYPDIEQLRSKRGDYDQPTYGPTEACAEALDASTGRCPGKDGVRWQYNLRSDGVKSNWNRYHMRAYSSFDVHKQPPKPTCPAQLTSSFEKVPERYSGVARDTLAYKSDRLPGCEGSSLSNWHQLLPGVSRNLRLPGRAPQAGENRQLREHLTWMTTLRGQSDNRVDACLAEMRGNKTWHSQKILTDDPKLQYLSHKHIIPDPSRILKTARRD